ncbi:hypothetical protein Tco_0506440 [Tanacetum coccineum]
MLAVLYGVCTRAFHDDVRKASFGNALLRLTFCDSQLYLHSPYEWNMLSFGPWKRILHKRTKMKQNRQNRAREWKEREKPKPKAHTSLNGPTRLRFLNFFNDPRIIREQRIAAYGFERGDGVVRVRMSAQDPYLYLCGGLVHRFEVLAWFSCCRGLSRQKKSHVAFIIDQEKVQAAG